MRIVVHVGDRQQIVRIGQIRRSRGADDRQRGSYRAADKRAKSGRAAAPLLPDRRWRDAIFDPQVDVGRGGGERRIDAHGRAARLLPTQNWVWSPT